MGFAWLLPIMSCAVAAASGGIVADVLPSPQCASATIVTSFILWSIGVPLALIVTVIYFMHLMRHKLSPEGQIINTFLPLGLLGQGGFG